MLVSTDGFGPGNPESIKAVDCIAIPPFHICPALVIYLVFTTFPIGIRYDACRVSRRRPAYVGIPTFYYPFSCYILFLKGITHPDLCSIERWRSGPTASQCQSWSPSAASHRRHFLHGSLQRSSFSKIDTKMTCYIGQVGCEKFDHFVLPFLRCFFPLLNGWVV
ncbi:hypothetical protein VTI74DRAFT_797 [Chaetomium olivicolor]